MRTGFETSNVVALFRASREPEDWSTQELANFYKVEHVLLQNGLAIEIARGVTDEGDPWFAFCHHDGEVFLHFARLRDGYVVAGPNISQPIWNKDFNQLLRALQDRVPLVFPTPAGSRGTVLIHPSVLLVAAVAGLFYQSSNLKAEELGKADPAASRDNEVRNGSLKLTDTQIASLMAAIAFMASVEGADAPGSNSTIEADLVVATLESDGAAEGRNVDKVTGPNDHAYAEGQAVEMASDAIEPAGERILPQEAIVAPAVKLMLAYHEVRGPQEPHEPRPVADAEPLVPAAQASPLPRELRADVKIEIQATTQQPLPDTSPTVERSMQLSSLTDSAASPEPKAQEVVDADSDEDVAQDVPPAAEAEDSLIVADPAPVPFVEEPAVSVEEKPVDLSWKDAKYFVVHVSGKPVLVANTEYNIPHGPTAEMVPLEEYDAQLTNDNDLQTVGIAHNSDAHGLM